VAAATRAKRSAGASTPYSGPYAALINRSARANGLDPWLLAALLWVESRFNPKARSSAGAVGIAQIELSAHPDVTAAEAENPSFAIPWAARYLALLKRHAGGSTVGALRAYNTGSSKPSPAGNHYADSVLGQRKTLRGQRHGASAGSSGGRGRGFLPAGATYKPGRKDQGQDFQTNPGGAIIAPGNGYVVAVRSDPNGFGPSYPVVHFTSGPYAGHDVYIGHTISALKAGAHFVAGQVLSHTGKQPIGNATVPGWAEIGFAPHGVPGPFGQPVPDVTKGTTTSFTGDLGKAIGGVIDPATLLPGIGSHVPGAGAVSGAVDAAKGVGELAAKVVSDPGYIVLWVGFFAIGLAFVFLGLERLLGRSAIRDARAAAVAPAAVAAPEAEPVLVGA
jgi:Transglycosylase SLT domain